MEDVIRIRAMNGEWFMTLRMISHFGKNPSNGGIPAKERAFKAQIDVRFEAFDVKLKFDVEVFIVSMSG